MKSQVLHTVWCNISGEATGEIWNWSLLGVKSERGGAGAFCLRNRITLNVACVIIGRHVVTLGIVYAVSYVCQRRLWYKIIYIQFPLPSPDLSLFLSYLSIPPLWGTFDLSYLIVTPLLVPSVRFFRVKLVSSLAVSSKSCDSVLGSSDRLLSTFPTSRMVGASILLM